MQADYITDSVSFVESWVSQNATSCSIWIAKSSTLSKGYVIFQKFLLTKKYKHAKISFDSAAILL